MSLISVAFLSLGLEAQAPIPATPPPTTCPQKGVRLPAALDRVLRDYETEWERGDEKALAALFSDDGFVMPAGGVLVRGRAAIERHYAESGGVPLSLRAIAFAVEGSSGFILGCYAPRAGESDIGKFTLTLKKDTGGRWLIFSDMDNSNRRR